MSELLVIVVFLVERTSTFDFGRIDWGSSGTRDGLRQGRGHVANGDMVTLIRLLGVLDTVVTFLARIIGSVVDRVVCKQDRG